MTRAVSGLPNFENCVLAITDTLVREATIAPSGASAVQDIAGFVLATHARMPDYLRRTFRALTLVFDASAYLRNGRPFHRLSPAERARQVRRWGMARSEYRRSMIGFYRSFVIFALYSDHFVEHGDLATAECAA